MLPEEVLEEFRESVFSFRGTGLGILELGHRTDAFSALLNETLDRCQRLLDVPPGYETLILHGGARMQFAMLPANHLADQATADYVESGWFSRMAIDEARRYGHVHVPASSSALGFRRLPALDSATYSAAPVYVHFTSNNTEVGTQFTNEPELPASSWLACDASSDLFTRPVDVSRYGLLYATSHKNLGTAGLALVIVRTDLGAAVRDLPRFFRYATHVESGSRYSTPPVVAVYVLNLVLQWIEDHDGLVEMQRRSVSKSALVYSVIDNSDFYSGLVEPDSRSRINVAFRAPSATLEEHFVAEAAEAGLYGLRGYRRVGHLRASLFNAIPWWACERLAEFMTDFARRYRHVSDTP